MMTWKQVMSWFATAVAVVLLVLLFRPQPAPEIFVYCDKTWSVHSRLPALLGRLDGVFQAFPGARVDWYGFDTDVRPIGTIQIGKMKNLADLEDMLAGIMPQNIPGTAVYRALEDANTRISGSSAHRVLVVLITDGDLNVKDASKREASAVASLAANTRVSSVLVTGLIPGDMRTAAQMTLLSPLEKQKRLVVDTGVDTSSAVKKFIAFGK